MKPEILQLSPILIPEINARLDQLFTVRRYYQQADKPAYINQHGANIRGVITGGHTGISQALMAQLPNLEVVAVNGVGTDAVDLAYARDRGIRVTATIGALTEDVADLAIGLLISVCRSSCSMPSTAFIGERISWLMLATKSDLARPAWSAASLACSSAACAARASVRSVLLPTQLRMTPLASFCGSAWLSKMRHSPSWRRSRQSQRNWSPLASARCHAALITGWSSGWTTADQSPEAISWAAGMPLKLSQ